MYSNTMEPTEEAQFWMAFGYQPEGVIFCIDCQKIHEIKCLRND
jgi:hypothetical protein